MEKDNERVKLVLPVISLMTELGNLIWTNLIKHAQLLHVLIFFACSDTTLLCSLCGNLKPFRKRICPHTLTKKCFQSSCKWTVTAATMAVARRAWLPLLCTCRACHCYLSMTIITTAGKDGLTNFTSIWIPYAEHKVKGCKRERKDTVNPILCIC